MSIKMVVDRRNGNVYTAGGIKYVPFAHSYIVKLMESNGVSISTSDIIGVTVDDNKVKVDYPEGYRLSDDTYGRIRNVLDRWLNKINQLLSATSMIIWYDSNKIHFKEIDGIFAIDFFNLEPNEYKLLGSYDSHTSNRSYMKDIWMGWKQYKTGALSAPEFKNRLWGMFMRASDLLNVISNTIKRVRDDSTNVILDYRPEDAPELLRQGYDLNEVVDMICKSDLERYKWDSNTTRPASNEEIRELINNIDGSPIRTISETWSGELVHSPSGIQPWAITRFNA